MIIELGSKVNVDLKKKKIQTQVASLKASTKLPSFTSIGVFILSV